MNTTKNLTATFEEEEGCIGATVEAKCENDDRSIERATGIVDRVVSALMFPLLMLSLAIVVFFNPATGFII